MIARNYTTGILYRELYKLGMEGHTYKLRTFTLSSVVKYSSVAWKTVRQGPLLIPITITCVVSHLFRNEEPYDMLLVLRKLPLFGHACADQRPPSR